MNNKKLIALAAMAITLGIFTLSGCGANSGEADATTAAVSSDTSAEAAEVMSESSETTSEATVSETTVGETSTAPVTTETSAETTAEAETTEAETLAVPVTPSAPDPNKFRLYTAEVKSGYPEICNIESIKARQKNDVENFYNTEFSNEIDELNYSCLKSLDSIIPNYDISVYKYIAEDVDYDGKDEYYLIIENEQITSDEYKQSYGEDINNDGQVMRKTITLYYIENNGETDFVYYMNGVSFGYHMFENGPEYQIVDYGDCKHLAQWYQPAYESGGNGCEMLIDRNRFFDMPLGKISEESSIENKMLINSFYTYVNEFKWDGSDYTAYYYAYEDQNENGEWIEAEDYHDITRGESEKLKWYYGE